MMIYSRKKAEYVITAIEWPLNGHLIKMLVVRADEKWRRQVMIWLF